MLVLETFQTSFKPMLLPNASSLLPMLLSAHTKKLGYHHSVLSLSFRNLHIHTERGERGRKRGSGGRERETENKCDIWGICVEVIK